MQRHPTSDKWLEGTIHTRYKSDERLLGGGGGGNQWIPFSDGSLLMEVLPLLAGRMPVCELLAGRGMRVALCSGGGYRPMPPTEVDNRLGWVG